MPTIVKQVDRGGGGGEGAPGDAAAAALPFAAAEAFPGIGLAM